MVILGGWGFLISEVPLCTPARMHGGRASSNKGVSPPLTQLLFTSVGQESKQMTGKVDGLVEQVSHYLTLFEARKRMKL